MVSEAGQTHGLFTMTTLIFDATNRSGSPSGAAAPAETTGPDLRMTDVAAESRRSSHQHERHNRQHRRGGHEPWRRTAAAPRLPQRDPRDEAGELRHGESGQRGVLVDPHRVLGDRRRVPQLLMGGRRRSCRREASGPRSRRALPARHASDGSSRRTNARSSRPSATTEPTVGTWFSSRCRWARLTAVIEGMGPLMEPGRRADGPR